MGDEPPIELPRPLAPETLAAQAMGEIDPMSPVVLPRPSINPSCGGSLPD
jgi:hypothetical protein